MSTETTTLPKHIPINKDRYDFRILKVEKKVSAAKGNKYLAFTSEIYNPETIVSKIDGKTYNVAGLKFNKIVMIETEKDIEALYGFMRRLKLPETIDKENPDCEQFVGKCYSDDVKSKEYQRRKDPTYEQLQADPNAKGEVMINHETGKPEVGYTLDCPFGTTSVLTAMKPA
jgi:hypothetical protein